MVPFMLGWTPQKYSYMPGFSNLCREEACGLRALVENSPEGSRITCMKRSLLTKVTSDRQSSTPRRAITDDNLDRVNALSDTSDYWRASTTER